MIRRGAALAACLAAGAGALAAQTPGGSHDRIVLRTAVETRGLEYVIYVSGETPLPDKTILDLSLKEMLDTVQGEKQLASKRVEVRSGTFQLQEPWRIHRANLYARRYVVLATVPAQSLTDNPKANNMLRIASGKWTGSRDLPIGSWRTICDKIPGAMGELWQKTHQLVDLRPKLFAEANRVVEQKSGAEWKPWKVASGFSERWMACDRLLAQRPEIEMLLPRSRNLAFSVRSDMWYVVQGIDRVAEFGLNEDKFPGAREFVDDFRRRIGFKDNEQELTTFDRALVAEGLLHLLGALDELTQGLYPLPGPPPKDPPPVPSSRIHQDLLDLKGRLDKYRDFTKNWKAPVEEEQAKTLELVEMAGKLATDQTPGNRATLGETYRQAFLALKDAVKKIADGR